MYILKTTPKYEGFCTLVAGGRYFFDPNYDPFKIQIKMTTPGIDKTIITKHLRSCFCKGFLIHLPYSFSPGFISEHLVCRLRRFSG